MKDAMDTYFEEKKERDRQRQLERQRWEQAKKRQKGSGMLLITDQIFVNFTGGVALFGIYGLFICFAMLFQLELPSEWVTLLNLEERYVPGMGLCILCFLTSIYLFPVFHHLSVKKDYAYLFFTLLWVELSILLLIHIIFVVVMQNKLIPILPAVIMQIIFIIAFYSQRKYLQTFTKTTGKNKGQP